MCKNLLKDTRKDPTLLGVWDCYPLKITPRSLLACICPTGTAVRHYFRGTPVWIRLQGFLLFSACFFERRTVSIKTATLA